MRIEVVYAHPEAPCCISLSLPAGATVEQALNLSGILNRCPEIDLACNKVGIFGQIASLKQLLAPGDRVEVYRPLLTDPKEIRRRRAAQVRPLQARPT
jgi:putative ubiquitin-RnfH superfamily antitoxin RatB of RatAB toxin-antitoxin module